MISPELFPAAVAAAAVLALAVAVFALLKLRRLGASLKDLEQRLDRSLENYQGLSAGAVGQGQHMARLEQDLSRLRTRMDQVAATGEGNGASFNQAIRMARKGCSAREIMETCGLSQVEADLVVLLHKDSQG
jgi:hypothetical protein